MAPHAVPFLFFHTARPVGAAGVEEWSIAATGMAAVAFAFFEPDSALELGSEPVAVLRQGRAALSASLVIAPKESDEH